MFWIVRPKLWPYIAKALWWKVRWALRHRGPERDQQFGYKTLLPDGWPHGHIQNIWRGTAPGVTSFHFSESGVVDKVTFEDYSLGVRKDELETAKVDARGILRDNPSGLGVTIQVMKP